MNHEYKVHLYDLNRQFYFYIEVLMNVIVCDLHGITSVRDLEGTGKFLKGFSLYTTT